MKADKVGGAPPWLHHNPCCLAKIRVHFHTMSANFIVIMLGIIIYHMMQKERNLHHQHRCRGIDIHTYIEKEREIGGVGIGIAVAVSAVEGLLMNDGGRNHWLNHRMMKWQEWRQPPF
ncbi:hypothetical protein HanPI659440_Chr03g0100221 [Helianthus annuus]|nr:hypothetical protein HanPI659440_Chr03g0100221 [Helianthus annuus]